MTTPATTPAKPRPLPAPSRWSAPYWEAARRHEFVVQQCQDCQHLTMYPKLVCPNCLSENLGWVPSPGRGEIYSIAVQQAGPPSGFESLVPYALVIVRLDEGLQLMSNLVGPGALDADIGDRIVVDFEDLAGADDSDGVTLPVFRLEESA